MEQNHNIPLRAIESYGLRREELRELYIYLALFQFQRHRNPDSNERALFGALQHEFREYYSGLQKLCEREPDSLILNRLRRFFDLHYKNIKEFADECREG